MAIRLYLDPFLGALAPFDIFFLPIFASAHIGLGPGLFSALISAGLADFFFIQPRHVFFPKEAADVFALASFMTIGCLISVAVSRLCRERHKSAAAEKRYRLLAEEVEDYAERFRALADNIPQLAWMATRDGNIFWYNKRWYDYTGTTFEQVAGWGWQRVHHPEYVERVTRKIKYSFETGTPWEDTFPLRGRSGNYRWFLSRAFPIRDERGEVTLWSGTNTDITEQMDSEASLRSAKEKLEEAYRDSELFSATVSHDLRAPLGNISNFIQIHLRKYPDQDSAFLQKALSATERMGRMMNHLLEFTRASSKNARMEYFEASDCVGDALDHLRVRIMEARAVINVAPLPKVYADRNYLTTVVQNLISNALKYRSERPMEIHVGATQSGDKVIFCVEDNGIGIEPKFQSKVFEVFRRVSPEAADGIGLGLTICRKLLVKMGGEIWLESVPGQGSRFYFSVFAHPVELASNVHALA